IRSLSRKRLEGGTASLRKTNMIRKTLSLALDDQGEVMGCFRLYPTVLPHMVSDQYPNMVESKVLRRPDVPVLTRFHGCKTKRRSSEDLELLTYLRVVGLELGLSGFTAIVRTLRIPVMQADALS